MKPRLGLVDGCKQKQEEEEVVSERAHGVICSVLDQDPVSCGLTGRSRSRVQVGQTAPQGLPPLSVSRKVKISEIGGDASLQILLRESSLFL